MRPIISEELLDYLNAAENISFFADEDEEEMTVNIYKAQDEEGIERLIKIIRGLHKIGGSVFEFKFIDKNAHLLEGSHAWDRLQRNLKQEERWEEIYGVDNDHVWAKLYNETIWSFFLDGICIIEITDNSPSSYQDYEVKIREYKEFLASDKELGKYDLTEVTKIEYFYFKKEEDNLEEVMLRSLLKAKDMGWNITKICTELKIIHKEFD
jgi:hypothetical protein